MAPALTGITSNFTSPNRRFNRKAPASPQTTRAGGDDQDGPPARVKAKGAAGEPKNRWVRPQLDNLTNIFQAEPPSANNHPSINPNIPELCQLDVFLYYLKYFAV